jgi:hypothetical protein
MTQPKITNDQLAGPFFDITNVVRVDKSPGSGAFTSIKTAIDSITTASVSNPIAVFVGPGFYIEDTITLKPYVKLIGWAGETHTIIQPSIPTQAIVIGVNSSMIQGFSLTGATGVGGLGLYFTSATNDPTGIFRISHVRFLANTINCHLISTGFDSYVLADSIYFVTYSDQTITHLKIESTGTSLMESIMDSMAIMNITGNGLSEAVLVTGAHAITTFNNVTIKAFGSNSVGDGIVVQDGGHVDVLSGDVMNFNKNLVARNFGAAPKFHIAVSMAAMSTTRDVSIEHPGTVGLFSGTADASKVFIDPASTVSANYLDLQLAGGTVIVGPLYSGPTHADITDISTLLNEALPVGLLSGGNLTQGINPLDINISAGHGYVVITSTSTHVKKINWTNQILTLPDNIVNYVYFDSVGTIARSDTPPDSLSTILLGRVKTLGGIITFIGIMPNNATRLSSKLRGFARDAIGCIFKTGSSSIENVTPFHLDVSSGSYYYADLNFLPSGGSNINFYPWIVTTGGWIKEAITNIVNHTQYNDTTTGFVPLTAGYFTKHTLWVGGDGINEQYQLIIGQSEYPTLAQAQSAPLPSISSGFAEITTPITAIIVQEGASKITEFIDIRPRIGFQNPSTSAATIHGNLFGLSADDHLQYLRVDGTRALSGNLSFGTHNLTSVGTVNGVSIESHASRHLPNGIDSLTTAAPTNNLSLISTNSTGIANSLARSDHSHAITGIPIIQIVSGSIPGSNGVTGIPFTNAIPLITDGTQIWSQAIILRSTASKVSLQFGITVDSSGNNNTIIVAIFRDNVCITANAWDTGSGAGDRPGVISIDFTDSPISTSVTYSARIGTTAGTWYCNSTSSGTNLGGVLNTTYRLSEIV